MGGRMCAAVDSAGECRKSSVKQLDRGMQQIHSCIR